MNSSSLFHILFNYLRSREKEIAQSVGSIPNNIYGPLAWFKARGLDTSAETQSLPVPLLPPRHCVIQKLEIRVGYWTHPSQQVMWASQLTHKLPDLMYKHYATLFKGLEQLLISVSVGDFRINRVDCIQAMEKEWEAKHLLPSLMVVTSSRNFHHTIVHRWFRQGAWPHPRPGHDLPRPPCAGGISWKLKAVCSFSCGLEAIAAVGFP